jgi:hypothetical protein
MKLSISNEVVEGALPQLFNAGSNLYLIPYPGEVKK